MSFLFRNRKCKSLSFPLHSFDETLLTPHGTPQEIAAPVPAPVVEEPPPKAAPPATVAPVALPPPVAPAPVATPEALASKPFVVADERFMFSRFLLTLTCIAPLAGHQLRRELTLFSWEVVPQHVVAPPPPIVEAPRPEPEPEPQPEPVPEPEPEPPKTKARYLEIAPTCRIILFHVYVQWAAFVDMTGKNSPLAGISHDFSIPGDVHLLICSVAVLTDTVHRMLRQQS